VKTYLSDVYSVNDKGARKLVKTIETSKFQEEIEKLTKVAVKHNEEEALALKADPKYVVDYWPTRFTSPTSYIGVVPSIEV